MSLQIDAYLISIYDLLRIVYDWNPKKYRTEFLKWGHALGSQIYLTDGSHMAYLWISARPQPFHVRLHCLISEPALWLVPNIWKVTHLSAAPGDTCAIFNLWDILQKTYILTSKIIKQQIYAYRTGGNWRGALKTTWFVGKKNRKALETSPELMKYQPMWIGESQHSHGTWPIYRWFTY